jgi:transportin-3
MAVIEVIVGQLVSIKPLLTSSHDDPDRVRGFCRVFTEAGETYRQLVLAHHETFFPIVEVIAECSAYSDLDVVQITFNFWYRLALCIGKKPSVPQQFYDLYKGLMNVMIRHLHYPPDAEPMTPQELDEFRNFRHVMGDTLKDCCFVLGTVACLRAVYDMVVLALGRTSGPVAWQEIEAPLFSMRSMGAEVDPKDDEVVPLIMDLIPRLPDHPQVRYAATLVISRYTEWVDEHPQYIDFQLGYISTGFQSSESRVSAAAGQAMKYLCKDCKRVSIMILRSSSRQFTIYI